MIEPLEKLTDVSDIASRAEERARQAAMSHRKPAGPAATGHCLNCGEPLAEGRRWCGADCRDLLEGKTQ